jgi:hypothetical protein
VALTRKQQVARYAVISRALDEPWTYDGDERDEDLWVELLTLEQALGRTNHWPHGHISL